MRNSPKQRIHAGMHVRVDDNDRLYVVWSVQHDKATASLLASDVSLEFGPDPGDETACLDRIPLERIQVGWH